MFNKWIVRCIILMALVLLVIVTVTLALPARASEAGPDAPGEDLGTGFTYQGQLNLDGQPVDNACDFQFSLYDDELGNVQVGTTQTITEVVVSDGLFTVQLDFGAGAFQGDARWLGIQVQCTGDATTSDMGLQALTATPYALYAMSARWDGITDVPAGFADGVDNGAAYQNVVIVAKGGGDYTSVQAAIDSIGDASAANPYLVWVAPGTYTETVTMKPHVHLQGAGQEATIIHSSVGDDVAVPTQATLILTDHVTLRDLTVDNSGGDILDMCAALMAPVGVTETLVADVSAQALGHTTENYAVHVMGNSGGYIALTLQNVTVLAENATDLNVGLHNYYHSTLTLRGGTFTARSGDGAYAITNGGDNTTLRAENVVALAEDAGENFGLVNGEAVVYLLGGSFTARGGTITRGIYNYTWSFLEAEGVTALGENSSGNNYGLENAMAKVILHGGAFTALGGAETRAIYNQRSGAALQAVDITALAQDSSAANSGLYNADEAKATLQGGAFTGRGGTGANGIYNMDANTFLETYDVAALGEQASIGNRGLYNRDGAEVILHGGSYVGHTGGSGILNSAAAVEAYDVFALGDGNEGSYTQGLLSASDGASAIINGGTFIARDASYEARAIYTWGDGAILRVSGALLLAKNGAENIGLFTLTNVDADVTLSTLEGSDDALLRNHTSGPVTVTNSRLVGDVSGTVTCVAVTSGATFYENTCP